MTLTGIFDTHAHYDDEQFDTDRDSIFDYLSDNGVTELIDCGCSHASSLSALALSEKHDFVYCAVGLHPEDISDEELSLLDDTLALYSHRKAVAIGEIGLDYHWVSDNKEKQKEALKRQVIFANEHDLPVIIHDRDAHADIMDILRELRPKGVMHCFSGSVEMAREVIELGLYIGIGGAVTFKNAKKPVAVAGYVPDDRLLLETDCPYMAPVPMRGKRCDSSMIAYTAERLAEIRHTDAQSIVNMCRENAKKLFGI